MELMKLRRALPGLTPTVESVVRTVLLSSVGGELDPKALSTTVQVMLTRLDSAPKFIGTPMKGATLFLDLFGVGVALRPFKLQSDAQRAKTLRVWGEMPVSFFKDFLDFYGKMAVFVYLSELEGDR